MIKTEEIIKSMKPYNGIVAINTPVGTVGVTYLCFISNIPDFIKAYTYKSIYKR
ncbi:MAG: hypothetical protein V1870_04220 [Candidatus Aenigmatarchaeota archaeon]